MSNFWTRMSLSERDPDPNLMMMMHELGFLALVTRHQTIDILAGEYTNPQDGHFVLVFLSCAYPIDHHHHYGHHPSEQTSIVRSLTRHM